MNQKGICSTLLRLMLMMAMVIGLLPGMGLTAYAGNDKDDTTDNTVTVTFKVKNGSWNDESTDDRARRGGGRSRPAAARTSSRA